MSFLSSSIDLRVNYAGARTSDRDARPVIDLNLFDIPLESGVKKKRKLVYIRPLDVERVHFTALFVHKMNVFGTRL